MRCHSLISIVIPNSVTSIREFAFYDCTGLISVTIPNSIIIIGDDAFYGCSSLTSITMPSRFKYEKVKIGLPLDCAVNYN